MPSITPPSSYTSNYNLSKWVDGARPGAAALNTNWDNIDVNLAYIQTQITQSISGSSASFLSNKIDTTLLITSNKLGINFTQVASSSHTHPASQVVENSDKQFVSAAEKATWGSASVGVELQANKGIANGYAGLGADGLVAELNLPSASVVKILGTGSAVNNSIFIDSSDFLLKHKNNIGTIYTLSKRTDRRLHAWVVGGEIKVASGSTDYIGGFAAELPTGYTSSLVKTRYRTYDGTAIVHIYVNDVVQVSSISVTATPGSQSISVALNDGDWVRAVVGSASGTPHVLQFDIYEDVVH